MTISSYCDVPVPTVRPKRPIALAIAGSDSGGGAGIQADLKTFSALEVHGTTAITCITAQNPQGVRAVQAIDPEIVRHQIEAVVHELPPRAAKTGMLFSREIIEVVADSIRNIALPLVVDPVMVATSGAVLLQKEAILLLQERLLPLATLVTPNLDEAQILTGMKLLNVRDLQAAARKLYETHGCAALVKGGHLQGRVAADAFFDGTNEAILNAAQIRGVSTHGTGCTYSAAIAAFLAQGKPLPEAVSAAKEFITRAIAGSYQAAGHFALGIMS